MPHFDSSDSTLLKAVLEPLLEDFHYWFERSIQFLTSHTIDFLGSAQQAQLLERVQTAQQEVSTAKMLLRLTEDQVGVETAVVATWHQLVHECWQVSSRYRREQSAPQGR
jgi:hypothetical protein